MTHKKIVSIVFIFLCALSFPSYAFNSVDSLKHLLISDKEDTNKVIHLNNIFKEYRSVGNLNSALQSAKAALTLAKQLNYKKGIANSYNNIGLVSYIQRDYENALEKCSTALKLRLELGNKN